MTESHIDWLKVARSALLSREMDRLEVEQLTPQGKIKYQFSASGHELAQALVAQAMSHPHDAATVYYRSRPFMLSSGLSAAQALAGGMARSGSLSQGRDAGVMFNLPRRDGLTILPTSGDVGAQYTPAVGWAQAICYHRDVLKQVDWDGAVAVAMGGEGSTAANGFWAALNIVTTLRLPMIFSIENNNYGLSTPSELQTPCGDIAGNLACFQNLLTIDADGTEPENAWQAVCQAFEHTRSGAGPVLLQLHVVRLTGHTFVDDQSYKSQAERTVEIERDPLERLKAFVNSTKQWEQLEQQVRQELANALVEAEASPEPDPAQARSAIFYEGQAPKQGGLRPENAQLPIGSNNPTPSGPRINLIDAVRQTLEAEMSRNPRLLVLGEDVGVKGGVHGATRDMQAHFGVERVFDTSLSEEGIIGRSVGMALSGLLPVPEIQFRKYADPAYEQIDDLGTLRWRTANNFAAPIVIRIPVGFSKKTGDPWHSVSGEAIYAHTLGWRIAYPSNAEDAAGLLRTALRGDDPTIFLEHRALLDTAEGRRPYPGDDFCLPYGQAKILLDGNELTTVTWGAMVHRCLEAARPFTGRVSVLDMRTIIPWDQNALFESVRQTGKVLIVHEDTLTNGFAAEICAMIASQAFTDLDAPIERIGVPDVPIPYNIAMMETLVPSVEVIRAKMEWLLGY
jgi:2-oxoisovalerate dehydrogenase E1 component